MLRVHLPKSREIEGHYRIAAAIILILVMRRAEWRADIKTARVAMSITDKLEPIQDAELKAFAEKTETQDADRFFDLTDEEHEMLAREMRLRNADGSTSQIDSVKVNRYYLECLEAVLDAKKPPS
jgi:hypothetical protein